MISYEDVRQLQQFPSDPGSLVLSVYVNVDQSNAANLNRGFETVVENLFRKMIDGPGVTASKERFENETRGVMSFLKGYTPRGKGLVIFSDSLGNLWWERDLLVNVPTEARWSPRPWLRPLLELLEEGDHLAVVLTDKQRARLLTVDATGVHQHAEIQSEVPNKHVTTGTDHIFSQGQMERDHAKHIKWHAKRVAEELGSLIDRMRLTRVVVGGPVEATSIFVSETPKRIQQMIVATVPLPLSVSDERLLTEVKAIRERAEHDDEVKLVESMLTSAHKGDRAVTGLSGTLAAVQQGRVHRLVIARDFHVEGRECPSCKILTIDGLDSCSFCGEVLVAAPDLMNRLTHRVLEQHGKVQIVSGEAAGKLGEAGVGAVLRF